VGAIDDRPKGIGAARVRGLVAFLFAARAGRTQRLCRGRPDMDDFSLVVIALHVAAVVAWIGGDLAMAVVATSAEGDDKLRGALARKLYQRVAAPGFALAFALGLYKLLTGWRAATVDANGIVAGGYAKAPWMHVKLTLALVVIAVHHVMGARAKKMMRDGAKAGPMGVLGIVVAVCALGAILMVVLRPFHG
jgi:putative membrane protein